MVEDEGEEQSLCTLIVGEAATRLLLLLVLLMVIGNCEGVPVGVWGDSGVSTEDVDDVETGLPMLFVVTDAAAAVAAAAPDEVVFMLFMLVAEVGVAGVDMATAEVVVDCCAVVVVVVGGDCC